MDKIKAIKQTVLFGSLSDVALSKLSEKAIEKFFNTGEVIFLEGQIAQGMYVVVSGAIRALRTNVDGREQVIHIERAGATFAEIPVFDGGEYPSTVVADEVSELLFIDKQDIYQLCLEHPEIALAALKVLSKRLRYCASLIESLSLKEVSQRIAELLLAEAQENKIIDNTTKFRLKLTNQQIAARVGTVREVVSRSFTRLQQDGLIKLEGREINLLDIKALAKHANSQII
ncbi:MAG: Crp/Fnr family transcriptional regulator [Blastocatellia bacterium]|nr:Crp/Fnr family transcriptional regulator [Blastocatellia bacterium]